MSHFTLGDLAIEALAMSALAGVEWLGWPLPRLPGERVAFLRVPMDRVQGPIGPLVGQALVGTIQAPAPKLLLLAGQARNHVLTLVPMAALDQHLATERRLSVRRKTFAAIDSPPYPSVPLFSFADIVNVAS